MNIFYLVRHGQKESKQGDPGLTDLGREQAEKTAEFFKDKNILGTFKEIFKNYPNKNILVITHGGIICDLLRNLFSDDELRTSSPDFLEKLDLLIKECSVTTIIRDNNKFSLREIGAVAHLV